MGYLKVLDKSSGFDIGYINELEHNLEAINNQENVSIIKHCLRRCYAYIDKSLIKKQVR